MAGWTSTEHKVPCNLQRVPASRRTGPTNVETKPAGRAGGERGEEVASRSPHRPRLTPMSSGVSPRCPTVRPACGQRPPLASAELLGLLIHPCLSVSRDGATTTSTTAFSRRCGRPAFPWTCAQRRPSRILTSALQSSLPATQESPGSKLPGGCANLMRGAGTPGAGHAPVEMRAAGTSRPRRSGDVERFIRIGAQGNGTWSIRDRLAAGHDGLHSAIHGTGRPPFLLEVRRERRRNRRRAVALRECPHNARRGRCRRPPRPIPTSTPAAPDGAFSSRRPTA